MSHTASAPSAVPVADLAAYVPNLRAGARALRERQGWAARLHLPTDVELLDGDAAALELLAARLDGLANDGHASDVVRHRGKARAPGRSPGHASTARGRRAKGRAAPR